jgi:hypothetical protein
MENGADWQAVSMEGRKAEILTKRPAAARACRVQPAQPAQPDGLERRPHDAQAWTRIIKASGIQSQ